MIEQLQVTLNHKHILTQKGEYSHRYLNRDCEPDWKLTVRKKADKSFFSNFSSCRVSSLPPFTPARPLPTPLVQPLGSATWRRKGQEGCFLHYFCRNLAFSSLGLFKYLKLLLSLWGALEDYVAPLT